MKMRKIDHIDQAIIRSISGDLPLESAPFAPLAQELGITEKEVVARIRSLADDGVMRRFGATLRHQQSGFPANVMIAWRAPEDRIDELGETLAGFRRVSHCYHRTPCEDFPFNLFSMVHGVSQEECAELAREMAEAVGLEDYDLLYSLQELKKTSMRYFTEED